MSDPLDPKIMAQINKEMSELTIEDKASFDVAKRYHEIKEELNKKVNVVIGKSDQK